MQIFSPPTREEYIVSKAWGMLTSLDIYQCDADIIRNPKAIREFTIKLCDKINVTRYGDMQLVLFGDDPRVHGYSMSQMIETSLISAHFAEESNSVYLDIFSCKYYDSKKLAEFSVDFLKGRDFAMHCILRGCALDLPEEFEKKTANRNIVLQGASRE